MKTMIPLQDLAAQVADMERATEEANRAMEKARKNVVTFRHGHVRPDDHAMLYEVQDHPRLGDMAVALTTRVLHRRVQEGALMEVETRNTVYRRRPEATS